MHSHLLHSIWYNLIHSLFPFWCIRYICCSDSIHFILIHSFILFDTIVDHSDDIRCIPSIILPIPFSHDVPSILSFIWSYIVPRRLFDVDILLIRSIHLIDTFCWYYTITVPIFITFQLLLHRSTLLFCYSDILHTITYRYHRCSTTFLIYWLVFVPTVRCSYHLHRLPLPLPFLPPVLRHHFHSTFYLPFHSSFVHSSILHSTIPTTILPFDRYIRSIHYSRSVVTDTIHSFLHWWCILPFWHSHTYRVDALHRYSCYSMRFYLFCSFDTPICSVLRWLSTISRCDAFLITCSTFCSSIYHSWVHSILFILRWSDTTIH